MKIIEAKITSIIETKISIHVVRIGKRQMSIAVLKQLPTLHDFHTIFSNITKESIQLDWSKLNIWGYVQYSIGAYESQLIYQHIGRIYRYGFERNCSFAEPISIQQQIDEFIEQQLNFKKFAQHFPQLFIAV